MTRKDGGPAFPGDYYSPEVFRDLRETEGVHAATKMASGKSAGMTLRDWFAGQFIPAAVERSREEPFQEASDVAAYLYEFADAMLAERDR